MSLLAKRMSQTEKALIYDSNGVDAVSFVENMPVPTVVGKKELLVKVISASLNPVDYKLPKAMPKFMLKGKTVGQDVCGTVVQMGSKVTNFSIGDVVFGFGPGLAEFALVSSDAVAKIPDSVPHDVAGCLGVAGLTAVQMLKKNGAFDGSDPKKILVIGASGGVGSLVVQIAKALCAPGTTIYGMCSARSSAFVQSLGATEIVDYSQPGFALSTALPLHSLDLVADCVSSPDDPNYVPEGLQLIKREGKYVAINSGSRVDWMKTFASKMTGINFFRGQYSLLLVDHVPADLLVIADLVATKKLVVHIHSRIGLNESELRKAYKELQGRRVHGKIVLVC